MLEPILERARADENVVGVLHSGSRGRGAFVTDASDWDAFVVVRELRGAYPSRHGDRVELAEVTLARLEDVPEHVKPALLSVDVLLDKTGEVAAAVERATTVDPATAGEPLDGYVNMLYRSLKNARNGSLHRRGASDMCGRAHDRPRSLRLPPYASISRAESAAKRSGRGERHMQPDLAFLRGE